MKVVNELRKSFMDINDFNSKYAKLKAETSDRNNDLRQLHRKQIDDLKEVNERKQDTQLKTFLADKRRLENENLASAERHKKATDAAISEKRQRFQESLKEKQEAFDKDVGEVSFNLRSKLKDMQTSFRRTQRENDILRDSQIRNVEDTLKTREKRNLNDYQANLEAREENTFELLDKTKKANKKEFKETVNKYKGEILKNEKANTVKLANMRTKNAQDREALVEENKTNNNLREIANDKKVSDIRKQNTEQKLEMQENYEGIVKKLGDKADAESEKIRRFNEEEKVKMDIGFKNELKNTKTENRQRVTRLNDEINGGGTKGRVEEKYEHKIDKLINKMKDQSYKNTADKERLASENKLEVKKLSNDFNERIEEDARVAKKYHGKIKASQEKQNREVIDSYKTRLARQEIDGQQQSLASKVSSDRRIDNQKQEFSNVIQKMTDKNVQAISNLQKENAEEKTEVIEGLRKQNHEEKEDLKTQFHRMISSKERSYEMKLHNLQKKNEKLVQGYETKIGKITTKFNNEIERNNKMSHERMAAREKDFKNELDLVNKKHHAESMTAKDVFERRLERNKNQADIYLTQVVNKYEKELATQREEAFNEKKATELRAQTEYANLYRQSELEKHAIRQQMESKLEGLKNQIEAREATLDQFKNNRA